MPPGANIAPMLTRTRARRAGLALLLAVALAAPAAPAYAAHQRRPAPAPAPSPSPSPLQLIPDLLSALLPSLFPPPSGGGAVAPSLQERVVASTVRVSGPACGRIQVGSGFSPRADLAVTAAHVVAGVSRPEVLRPDGRRLAATVVAFDPNQDLAVLRVNGLSQAPLPLGSPVVGTDAAVFGHPNGRATVEVSPARVTAAGVVRAPNIYGQLVSRDIVRLATSLDPGDSGGAVVDTGGNVVGVAYGVSLQRTDVAFAVNAREVQSVLNRPLSSPVSTGPCIG